MRRIPKYFDLNDCNKNTDNTGDTCSHCLHIWTISSVAVHHEHHHSSCCEGRSLFVIHLHSVIWVGEMGSFAGSMCLCLCLSVLVVLTLPLTASYFKWPTAKGEGEREYFRMHKQRMWLEGGSSSSCSNSRGLCCWCLLFSLETQVNKGNTIHLLHLSFFEGTVFFFQFLKTIELFCLPFHFRLGKTWRLVCIQIINLDLSLEGERLICYVLKTPFDFPPVFCPKVERNACFVSPVSLPQKDIDP